MNLRKSLFTWNDSWIWAAITAFVLTLSTIALRYQVITAFDVTGFTILLAVVTTLLGMVSARYIIRAKYLDEWNEAYQCDAGCAVINRGLFKDVDYDRINNILYDAAKYWIDWARTRKDAPKWVESDAAVTRLENSLEYKTIFLVKGPIVLYNPYYFGKAAGINEKESGVSPSGKTAADTQLAAGYVDIWGNPVVSGNDLVRMYELVKHENSHVFLSALGYAPGNNGELHHKIFTETGYC